MTAKRFMVDDCGTLIDMSNRNTYDYVSDVCDLLNELYEEKEQLLSDKEHLMGYLIRFRSFDDDDLDYVMNRESNRECGKQYYKMKEEDW